MCTPGPLQALNVDTLPYENTLPLLKVNRNPKTVIAISRSFDMIFGFWINESDRFFKGFQMVLTKTPRTPKIGPRSYKSPPPTRSTFREGNVWICCRMFSCFFSRAMGGCPPAARHPRTHPRAGSSYTHARCIIRRPNSYTDYTIFR